VFRFASPYIFILLAAIPALIFHHRRQRPAPAMAISRINRAIPIKPSLAIKFIWIVPVLKYTAFALMVIALARPQWGTRQIKVLTEGINIILAVDVSGSMRALDFALEGKRTDRLSAVKAVVADFIARRNGDRIGMVVFGTRAFTQTPLTRDYNALLFVIDRLEIGSAGMETAIGDAIGISIKRLKDVKSKTNIIILLTDGQSNAGEISPEIAMEIAAEKNIKIYCVGVGSRGAAPFLVGKDMFGRDIHRNYQVDFDEKTLQKIAEKTGGLYFKADDTDGLRNIYERINELEKTEVKLKTFAEYRELYVFFLIPSLMLLLIWTTLVNTRFLRVP